ncbi:MAG: hypothetical protein KAT04_09715 [Methylococcales bacterium]|nr:hypothetical protein [Methylococcales bacterium]
MKINFIFLFIFLFALSGCKSTSSKSAKIQNQAQSVSSSGTLVIKPIVFKKGIHVRESVKNECDLTGKLATYIKKNSSRQFTKIITESNSVPAKAQVLSIVIEQVQGSGGGAWSGAKMVLIKGKLTRRGKLIGGFRASRYSGGGMWGAYKGTCNILGRCVKVLGKDVSKWLANPTHNALLGNA